MITIDQLSIYYQHHCAIDGLSCQFESGDIIGVLGQNGAGKTTLLKTLARLIWPGSGRMIFEPDTLTTGFLPETPALYNDMTIEGFLQWCARLYQRKNMTQAVQDCMMWCDLTDRADHIIGDLSHGYKKRVGLAQCLLTDPDVLLLDEPLSGLDPTQMVQLRGIIKRVAHQDKIIIISSHMLSQLEHICQRILVIHEGKLIADKPMSTLQETGHTLRLEVQADVTSIEALLDEDMEVLDIQTNDTITTLVIRTQSDMRSILARRVVDAGLPLLTLSEHTTALESTFLQLVSRAQDHG